MLKRLNQAFLFRISVASFILILLNCSTPNHRYLLVDEPNQRAPAAESIFFHTEVQPILDRRCVVCHTCNDAPCQLHLDSYQGIRRGATYSDLGSSVLYTPPTRDKDANSTAEWRKRKFFPVVPDGNDNNESADALPPAPATQESLLYRFAELGHHKNIPGFSIQDVIKHREESRTCAPNAAAFEDFAKSYPFAGMPYGLPGLNKKEMEILKKWIDQGAPQPRPLQSQRESSSAQPMIERWEALLNKNDKSKLMARYIYEHVFSAHIHFRGTADGEWYEMVRSTTQSPYIIQEIVTPRPYDNPGTMEFYYRFKRFNRTVARAAHIPWEIDDNSLVRLRTLFLQTPWLAQTKNEDPENEDVRDPGYLSVNPFKYFQQIPARLRYQFLLENSQLIANAMIRGPACSGRVATNAIRDHFWVFFLKPESDVTVLKPEIAISEWAPLSELDLKAFVEPSLKYTTAMQKLKPKGFELSDLWTGEQKNPNSLLTIFRHGTNASVHHGLIGGRPLTYWVLNYSNFERIYYNLVADFEVWGSSTHKASTWNYMSRHRSEAEERFISFLPAKHRKDTRALWTQGLGSAQNFTQAALSDGINTTVVLNDENNPVDALLTQMQSQYNGELLNPEHQLEREKKEIDLTRLSSIDEFENWEQAFLALAQKKDLSAVRYFPDITYVRLGLKVYTIVNHRFYKFNNLLALEKLAYEPSKNKLYLLNGLIGARPEYFLDLKKEQMGLFLEDLRGVVLFKDWVAFKNKYFVRRNQARVWTLSDWFTDWLENHLPLDAGILDLRDYDQQSDQ